MRTVRHLLTDCAVLFAVLGIPFLCSDTFRQIIGKAPDAVSSASVILDQPSGNYVVLMNTEKHPDAENLALWETFFTGKDAPVIFEDISCMAAANDAGGCEMAESCRSRLPENQMQLRRIDGTLLLSKAEHGLFDTVILSAEFAEHYAAERIYGMDNIRVLYVSEAAE